MRIVVALVQLVLHYLGIVALLFGVVAFVFGNEQRGKDLLIGGLGFIVLKYMLGMIYVFMTRIFANRTSLRGEETDA